MSSVWLLSKHKHTHPEIPSEQKRTLANENGNKRTQFFSSQFAFMLCSGMHLVHDFAWVFLFYFTIYTLVIMVDDRKFQQTMMALTRNAPGRL
jgi:hypothetical protein